MVRSVFLAVWVCVVAAAASLWPLCAATGSAGARFAQGASPAAASNVVEAAQAPAQHRTPHATELCDAEAAELENDSEGKSPKEGKKVVAADEDEDRLVELNSALAFAAKAVAARAWAELMGPADHDLQPETPPPRA